MSRAKGLRFLAFAQNDTEGVLIDPGRGGNLFEEVVRNPPAQL